MLDCTDVCSKGPVSSEEVRNYAARACREYGEAYCIVEIEEKRCKTSDKPIDFIYERLTDTYALEKYATDTDLIRKI